MEASAIYLVRGADETLVEAVLLDDLDKLHLEQLETTWVPVVEQVKRTMPRDRWPEDWHWNWRDKLSHARQTFGQRGFCIVCEGGLQGAMLLDLARRGAVKRSNNLEWEADRPSSQLKRCDIAFVPGRPSTNRIGV